MGKIMSIMGPPACGKTLLSEKLSKKLNCELIKEFYDMPTNIVRELNENPHSLKTQIWFRNRRTEAMLRAKKLSKYRDVILDTCFLTSEVHIREMKDEFERKLATEMNQQDINLLGFPDIMIGIVCSEKQLYKFFRKRNAEYEQAKESFNHHCQVRKLYLELYKKYPNIIQLNTEGMDFHDEKDVLKIISLIKNEIIKKKDEKSER